MRRRSNRTFSTKVLHKGFFKKPNPVRNSVVEAHSDEMVVDGSIPSVPTTIPPSFKVKHDTFNIGKKEHYLRGEQKTNV
jgi:hypothetical protein